MKIEYLEIPKPISEKDHYPKGASVPTRITAYKCPCGRGRIENHTVSGFVEDFFVIKCRACEKKYAYVERSGFDFALYVQGE